MSSSWPETASLHAGTVIVTFGVPLSLWLNICLSHNWLAIANRWIWLVKYHASMPFPNVKTANVYISWCIRCIFNVNEDLVAHQFDTTDWLELQLVFAIFIWGIIGCPLLDKVGCTKIHWNVNMPIPNGAVFPYNWQYTDKVCVDKVNWTTKLNASFTEVRIYLSHKMSETW